MLDNTSDSHLVNVPHVAVDSNQGEVILGTFVKMQSWIHVWLALQVLGPPFIDVPVWREWNKGCLNLMSCSNTLWQCVTSSICDNMFTTGRNILVFHLVHVDLERRCVILEHSGHFDPVCVWILITGTKRLSVTLCCYGNLANTHWTQKPEQIMSYYVRARVLSPMDSRYLA